MSKNSYEYKNISIHARNDVLRAIEARASECDLSLPKAAVMLIEAGASQVAPPPVGLINLEAVPTDDLIDEIAGRLLAAGELQRAIERAEMAEAKLFAAASALGGAA